jgi:DNA polymerase-1
LPIPRLFLIDSFGFIFRAYHARARSGAPPMRTKTGLSTEAVYIFHNMVRKLMTSFKPDYIAAIFESSEPTFRSESFAEYKANRTEMPHDWANRFRISVACSKPCRFPSSSFRALRLMM